MLPTEVTEAEVIKAILSRPAWRAQMIWEFKMDEIGIRLDRYEDKDECDIMMHYRDPVTGKKKSKSSKTSSKELAKQRGITWGLQLANDLVDANLVKAYKAEKHIELLENQVSNLSQKLEAAKVDCAYSREAIVAGLCGNNPTAVNGVVGIIPVTMTSTVAGVYFMVNVTANTINVVDSEIVYIGQSRNIIKRLAGHHIDFFEWNWIGYIPVASFSLNGVERKWIDHFMPRLNNDITTCRKRKEIANHG